MRQDSESIRAILNEIVNDALENIGSFNNIELAESIHTLANITGVIGSIQGMNAFLDAWIGATTVILSQFTPRRANK